MLYEAESGDIQIALSGDALITRKMSVFREERFLALMELLRGADVTFTNAEILFHNYEDPPAYVSGGTYARAEPQIIKELQWLGVDVVSCANNHAYDFGENGILTNIRNLDQAGMPHAGTGRNLAEARSPAYLDTPKGRVALIAATTSGPPPLRAADQWRDGIGRPGANMIRYSTRYTVDREAFDAIRRLSEKLGWEELKAERRSDNWRGALPGDGETTFYVPALQSVWQYPAPSGATFVLGDHFETELIPNPDDLEENLQRIRDARRMADWVIVSLHNHEEGKTVEEPSNLAIVFAKAAIDAGADVLIGHGPHLDRGIEIYNGKPIFYSLGQLTVQHQSSVRMPRDAMLGAGLRSWEATPGDYYDARTGRELLGEWKGSAGKPVWWRNAVATVSFKARQLEEIRIYPIDLGYKRPRPQRGRPLLAEGEVAQEVLKLFQRLSRPFGTKVETVGNVGVIRPSGSEGEPQAVVHYAGRPS